MCLHDHNNDVYSLVFFKKNYSLRYELLKMAIFCFLPCYFLPVGPGVAKRDVIGGLMQINPFLYREEMILYSHEMQYNSTNLKIGIISLHYSKHATARKSHNITSR